MCYECTKPHQVTMGQHTGQVWVGTVSFEVTSRHDKTVKIAKVPHSLSTHVGFGEGNQLTQGRLKLFLHVCTCR